MNTMTDIQQITLQLRVHDSITVLPRILQILSRRGIKLTELRTVPLEDGTDTLYLTIASPEKWQASIDQLLARLVDVEQVSKEQVSKEPEDA